jgi:hypothetical protein
MKGRSAQGVYIPVRTIFHFASFENTKKNLTDFFGNKVKP